MSHSNPTPTSSGRHTSPQAKWLLNEVAALRGELSRVVAKQQQLAKREAELRKTIDALELVVAPLPVPAGLVARSVVHAHQQFGPRGILTRVLLDTLESAWPKGVDTHSLLEMVASHCGIQFSTSKERTHCRRNVVHRLRHLVDSGRVERLPGVGGHDSNSLGVWRWKNEMPSWSQLEQQHAPVAAHQVEPTAC